MLPLNNELESYWCQKLTEHIKIILHPKYERKRIIWHGILYGTLIFQQSNVICIGRHATSSPGRFSLALQGGPPPPPKQEKSALGTRLASMLEGILLPSNMAAKTTFCLCLVKRLIVTLRCAVNVTIASFQHLPWSLSAKFVFRKRLFIILKITFWSRDKLQTYSF